MARPAAFDPGPPVILVRCLTVAKVDSIGLVTGMKISASAGSADRSSLVGRWWSAYGATVRDRGAGSEAGWAGRCCSMGREPVLVGGRPCDLPGCAVRADP
jgi:hypothetical protein